ncbi:MAG: T9SS type A sorting domain-containing protein [Bacteroidota bacterium]
MIWFLGGAHAGEEHDESDVRFFPNPANEELTVGLANGSWYLEILTANGSSVRKDAFQCTTFCRKVLDVSDLPAGICVLRVKRGNSPPAFSRIVIF